MEYIEHKPNPLCSVPKKDVFTGAYKGVPAFTKLSTRQHGDIKKLFGNAYSKWFNEHFRKDIFRNE